MSNPAAPAVQNVVFHRPGPAWQMGVAFREQPGVAEHVAHYRALHAPGKLALGGPFLMPDSGGLMVAVPAVGQDELEAFAAAPLSLAASGAGDPAVQSGLLIYEVRPWHVAMCPAA